MVKRFSLLCFLSLLLLPIVWSQPNSLLTRTFRAPVPEGAAMPAPTDLQRVRSELQYFDGMGRPLQQVAVKATPAGADLVSFQQYDAYGREPLAFLPYVRAANNGDFRVNPTDEQDLYYEPYYWPDLPVTDLDAPYAVSEFERSPLGRVVEQGAPAAAWQPDRDLFGHSTRQGHTLRTTYRANLAGEVAWFPPDAGDGFQVTQSYPVGELKAQEVRDENDHLRLSFTDKQGKLILEKEEITPGTWAETYRVYDAFGRPSLVIQPEGVARLFSNQASGRLDSVLEDFAFRYRYDARGRLIEKKLPGADWEERVYDHQDQVRLLRDGNLRASGQWRFTKYDALGRPVQSGLLSDVRPRTALQAVIDAQPFQWEHEASLQGYSNRCFPDVSASTCELQTLTYYDHHDFNRDGDENDPEEVFVADPVLSNVAPEGPARARVTGERTRILGENRWLLTATWYDRYGRPVQVAAQNHLGGEDRQTFTYSFTGEPDEQHLCHSTSTEAVQVYQRQEYDPMGRLLRTWHDVRRGSGTWMPEAILLAEYEYDELGHRITKELHGDRPGGTFLQQVDFSYHLRGWLTDINRVSDSCESSVLSGDPVEKPGGEEPMFRRGRSGPEDLFALKLFYEKSNGLHGGAGPRYGGNVSSMSWQHAGACAQGYAFAYDGLSRLTSAWYAERNGPNQWGRRDRYNGSFDYDRNGNLISLERKGLSGASSFGWIDRLTYAYQGNRLLQVEDAVTTALPNGVANFQDGAHLPTEYHYDPSGNLIRDDNRGLSAIVYNQLHKPSQISLAGSNLSLNYAYSASGAKLRKVFSGNASDYIGRFQYFDSVLVFFAHPEGRVVSTGPGVKDFAYQYFLSDHLGNVRVVFGEGNNGAVALQRTDYYPFGMSMAGGPAMSSSPGNAQLYNGVEQQEELDGTVYDTRFRSLDVALGRWWQMDPVTEGFDAWTPYNSNLNNPIRFNDPDGDCPRCFKLLAKMGIKSIRKGKVDASAIVELGQDAWAIVDPASTWFDRAEGLFNLLSPVDTRDFKTAKGLYDRFRHVDKDNIRMYDKLGDGYEFVFRGDLRNKDEIFKPGFWAKGNNDNLLQHVSENPIDSRFISTSRDVDVASQFTGKEGYVYIIRKPKNGIDVNKELKDNFFDIEKEIAVPGRIMREDIMGAIKVRMGELDDVFDWNPYFKP